MTDTATDLLGSVVALWRYPVKSMLGEELNASMVTERGLLGDRAYALMDPATGKVASAKHPKKWPHMFECRSAYAEPPSTAASLPPVRVTLPDGTSLVAPGGDLDDALSRVLGRDVVLASSPPEAPSLEEYWPDLDDLAHRDTVTEEAMPPGTFFDLGVVHLLTTATLDRLRYLNPEGRFEVRRFRPNIMIGTEGAEGFVENDWIGAALAIGDELRLRVTEPCPRCVMTTLPQGDLPRDPGILRTAAKHNAANVGVYASVLRGGTIRRGDRVTLEATR